MLRDFFDKPKSLMTLMTVTLMTGFMNTCTHIHHGGVWSWWVNSLISFMKIQNYVGCHSFILGYHLSITFSIILVSWVSLLGAILGCHLGCQYIISLYLTLNLTLFILNLTFCNLLFFRLLAMLSSVSYVLRFLVFVWVLVLPILLIFRI